MIIFAIKQLCFRSFNIEYIQNPPDKSNEMLQKINTSLRWNFNSKIFGGCLGNTSFVTKYADIKGNGERCLYGVINVFKINIEALRFLWSSKLGFKTPTTE